MASSMEWLTTSQRVARSAEVIHRDLQSHFATIPRWEIEKILQPGGYGVVARVKKESRRRDGHVRRLAVKRALIGGQEANALRNEISYLKKLRGAEHIIKIIAARDDDPPVTNPQRPRGLRSRLFRLRDYLLRRRRPRDYFLQGLQGPVVALEWMENGDFQTVVEKSFDLDIELPNRVLWSIFLCLIRGCIAMAYPIHPLDDENYDFDAPTQLENIPVDGSRPPTNIFHGDLHFGNMMIGSPGDPFPEHNVFPVTKLIDFGLTRELEGEGEALTFNMGKICLKMVEIISQNSASTNVVLYNGIATYAGEILPTGNGFKYPMLCPALRDFLAYCLAIDVEFRPTLTDMFVVASGQVNSSPATYAPYEARETDEAIEGVLQQLVYNGVSEPEVQQAGPRDDNAARFQVPAPIWASAFP